MVIRGREIVYESLRGNRERSGLHNEAASELEDYSLIQIGL